MVTVFECLRKTTPQEDQFTHLATPIDVMHWWLKDEPEMAIPKYFTKPDKTAWSQNEQSSLLWTRTRTHLTNTKPQQDVNHFIFSKSHIWPQKKFNTTRKRLIAIIGQRWRVQHNIISVVFFFFNNRMVSTVEVKSTSASLQLFAPSNDYKTPCSLTSESKLYTTPLTNSST